MKKIYLFIAISLFINGLLYGQINIAFHENFELPSQSDSLVSSQVASAGIPDWGINTRLQSSGSQSDSCQVKPGLVCYLTSLPFSTVDQNFIELHFDQICKVNFFDTATIEISNNGGASWMRITGNEYLGMGSYGSNFNRFNSASYGNLWLPLTSAALPQNTWWKHESFDVSAYLANSTQAMIRFRLADGGPAGASGNTGWFLDNIKLKSAIMEWDPPFITLINPPEGDIILAPGIEIKAKINDESGIDTAFVVYTVNNGMNDTVGMIPLTGDTMVAFIPDLQHNDIVCFFVVALDNSIPSNSTANPVTACISFKTIQISVSNYFDSFDDYDIWTPSGAGLTQWQRGIPFFGLTSNAYSQPFAWDINLNSAYQGNANSMLTSPPFDFSTTENARVSFWFNCATKIGKDGVRLEYTINNSTWLLIGNQNDTVGENWYNSSLVSSGGSAGWSGFSLGWKKAEYPLGFLDSILTPVKFRFVFTSDLNSTLDGFTLDDFRIFVPEQQEVALSEITSPNTGCNTGLKTINILVKNIGSDTINSGLTASYMVQNGNIHTEVVSDTILPGAILPFNFTTPVDITAGLADSTFHFKVWVDLEEDPNQFDDTLTKIVISRIVSPPPSVANASIAYGENTVLTASSSSPVFWYTMSFGGNAFSTSHSFLTPHLYDTTIYYAASFSTSGCYSQRVPDTVFVGGPPPQEMCMLAIETPVTGYNLSGFEPVRIKIRNAGTQAIGNFPVSYRITGETPVTEFITQLVNPGDTLIYTFNQTVNMIVHQVYTLKSWVKAPDDLVVWNDTITKMVESKEFLYCTASATSTGDEDIGNVSISNLNNGNAIPQTHNSTSSGTYTNYTITVPPVNLIKGSTYPISITPIFLSSPYHNCVKVFVDWNNNGVFEPVTETAFSSGPIQTGSHTGTLTVPLNALTGYTRFRVMLVETSDPGYIQPCNDYTWGETEDYTAFVYVPFLQDASLTAILKPGKVCQQNIPLPVSVLVTNYGINPIQNMDIVYVIDTMSPVIQTWNGILGSGQQTVVNLPALTINPGWHSLCAYTLLQGDTNFINDKACISIFATMLTGIPYENTFDSLLNQDFTASTSTGTNWIYGSPDPGNFPLQGPFSAPGLWATNLNTGGYTNNALCYLTSPIFDFSLSFNARIRFNYSMNTQAHLDGVRVQYSMDAGQTWLQLGTSDDPLGYNWNPDEMLNIGCGWSGLESGWKNASFLLSNLNYSAGIQFRFEFSSNNYTTGDGFAIDNFRITLPCKPDLGIDSIVQPYGLQIPTNSLYPVEVRIKNYGSDTLYSAIVHYLINSHPVVTEMCAFPQGLFPEQTLLYTFATPCQVSSCESSFAAWTSLPGDCDQSNDTTATILRGVPVYVAPYNISFDSLNQCDWHTSGTLWELGTPSSTIIDSAYSAPYCWKTDLDTLYGYTGQREYLYSPFIIGLNHLDSLKFKHRVHIGALDGGIVEYLSVSGWRRLGTMGDPNATNWYNTGNSGWNGTMGLTEWIESAYRINILMDMAEPTQFRFSFLCLVENTEWDGWAIDDFQVTSELPTIDAGIGGIQQPFWICQAGDSLHVQIFVKNYGADTLHEIPVKYSINGIIQAEEVFVNSLIHGQSVAFEFAQTLHIPGSNFVIKVFTDMPDEQNRTNDTLESSIQVIGQDEINGDNPFFQISPTPCKTDCQVQIFLTKPGILRVSFLDITGKLMLTREITGQQGLNTLEFDVSGLSPGSYICRAATNGKIYHARLTVIK